MTQLHDRIMGDTRELGVLLSALECEHAGDGVTGIGAAPADRRDRETRRSAVKQSL